MATGIRNEQVFHSSEDVYNYLQEKLSDKLVIEHVKRVIHNSDDEFNKLQE